PAAPTGLHTTGVVTTTSVSLAWTGSATATSYTVTRTLSGNATVVGTVNAPTVTLTDNSARPSASYVYTVTASVAPASVTAPASPPATVSTATPAATGLAAAPVDDLHVSISWDRALLGVDSY